MTEHEQRRLGRGARRVCMWPAGCEHGDCSRRTDARTATLIAAVIGTNAELIKIAPVINRLAARNADIELWYTAMHVQGFAALAERVIPGIHLRVLGNVDRGTDVARVHDIPRWLGQLNRSFRQNRTTLAQSLERDGRPPLILVHGDTFTTVAGALAGRRLRVPVAHIEAGYRSGSVFAPFPEEIDRRLVAGLAHIHFAPSAREAENLRNAKGRVINTRANTALDALRLFLPDGWDDPATDPYGLVTLHRFELMRRPSSIDRILEICNRAAQAIPIRFITGEHGRARLAQHGLLSRFDDRFTIVDRVPYADFVPILARSNFVLTDSGGLQQECAYLGIPCLIHRERTESDLGLGRNVVLSGLSTEAARRFLEDPERFRATPLLDEFHPSDRIVEELSSLGYAP